jgi:biopolymer transport protein ExbD
MKAYVSKRAHYDSGPNMTPLVDIVMVILIFLMLAGSFGAAAHFLPGAIPQRTGGPVVNGNPELRTDLDLYVTSVTDDTFRARLGSGETFSDIASLTAALEARRAAHEAQGTPARRVQVLIEPRASTRFHHVTAVYEAAMQAKWPNIGFRAAKE